MALIRLQKYLSEAGLCSRRHGEALILQGRVTVNGNTVSVLGVKVDPKTDAVAVNGRLLKSEAPRIYIALNKPPGYVSSCRHAGKKIVLELVDLPHRVFPVGRLDEDSEGLLLMTNDGALHNRLSHPSFDHEKEYEVTVAQPITDQALREMADGIMLKGKKTRRAEVHRINPACFRITLKEGRNRQIRRMVEQTGNQVTVLKRIRIANIRLGGLAMGKWRHLSADETRGLLNAG
ncbi:MAG: pseudouridine synthase [Desulfobacterales bacterium]|nr:pseudouridine synthase [Desulfobacterales bacterium]